MTTAAKRYCSECSKDLSEEIEGVTYSEWSIYGTAGVIYTHEEGYCEEVPSMSYYNKCTCCKIEFDLSELEFDTDEEKNIYCSVACHKKHIRVCLANVEEPDIIY